MLTETTENYLKHIYLLQNNNAVSTNDLANILDVAPSSVTKMLKKLNELGMIDYESHRGVRLTEVGEKTALKTVRKHRLLEAFLVEILGYSWDQVHEEACLLEHYISDRFENSIDKLLNYPKYDPHGDPIPTKDGKLPFSSNIRLSEVNPGMTVKINRIILEHTEFLGFVKEIGLTPNTEIEIIDVSKHGGTINFMIESKFRSISLEAAKNIFVVIKD